MHQNYVKCDFQGGSTLVKPYPSVTPPRWYSRASQVLLTQGGTVQPPKCYSPQGGTVESPSGTHSLEAFLTGGNPSICLSVIFRCPCMLLCLYVGRIERSKKKSLCTTQSRQQGEDCILF